MLDNSLDRSGRKKQIIFVGCVSLLISSAVLLMVVPLSNLGMLSWHGLFHASISYQIAHGIVPPTNPVSIASPINYYWAWHAWIALLTKIFFITPAQASLVNNVLALWIYILGVYFAAATFVRVWWQRSIAVLLTGSITSYPLWCRLFHFIPGDSIHSMCIDSAFWLMADRRVWWPLKKFFNSSGFTMGFALFAFLLCIVAWAPFMRRKIFVLGVAICTILIGLFQPITWGGVIAIVAAYIIVNASQWLVCRDNSFLKNIVVLTLAFTLSIVVVLPYILPIAQAFKGQVGFAISEYTVRTSLFALCVSAPLYVWSIWRWSLLPSSVRLYTFVGIVLAIGSLTTVLTDSNQYKFLLLFCVPTALLAVAGITYEPFVQRYQKSLWYVCGIISIAGCALGLHFFMTSKAVVPVYEHRSGVMFLSDEAQDAQRIDLQHAYTWLRTQTPSDAYILQQPVDRNQLELSSLTQRRTVVALPSIFSHAIPHHDALVESAQNVIFTLKNCQNPDSVLQELWSAPATWPHNIYILVRYDDVFSCKKEWYRNHQVFASNHVAIFRVLTPGS